MDEVNQQIYDLCRQYADEYRKAFLDTGGTEEEWEAHKIQINVGYEIKSQTDQYLSFIVRGRESWTTAYSESRYYNIDVNTGKRVTLAISSEKIMWKLSIQTSESRLLREKKRERFSGQRRKADFPESQRMQNSMSTKPEILSLPLKDMKSRPVRPER